MTSPTELSKPALLPSSAAQESNHSDGEMSFVATTLRSREGPLGGSGDDNEKEEGLSAGVEDETENENENENEKPEKDRDGDGSRSGPYSSGDSSGGSDDDDDDDTENDVSPSAVVTRTVSEVHDGIESRRDLEIGAPEVERRASRRSSARRDPNLVTWEGPDDLKNPKNWSFGRKWAAITIVSMFTLISPVSSTMIAPATPAIGRDLGINDSFQQALMLSIFVLAYAVGPLFLGPMSEQYGRVPVLQLSNLIYLFFNLGCGLARTRGQMIAFRFLAGLGGSAPLAIGGGVLSDLFTAEQRGRAMSIYSLAPLLGPAVGPIAGGFISERTSWRWIFYATTLADAAIQLAGLFLLQETYAPVLLRRKCARLARETGNDALHTDFERRLRAPAPGGSGGAGGGSSSSSNDNKPPSVAQTLAVAVARPFRLLATQLIVQLMGVYMMFLYGLLYLQLSSFPTLWSTRYGESVEIGGLNYISLGVGLFLGAQACAPTQDRIYAALKRREGVAVGRPEFRTPMMVPGAVLVPVGLLIYGWCAQYRTHWIWPNIGVAIFAAGVIVGFQCIQGYLVDTYTRYAASAIGAATVLRSLAGFGFPLFAPYLYDRLDYGWGNTLLALIAVVIGWPSPLLLWRYGAELRQKSPFAAGA